MTTRVITSANDLREPEILEIHDRLPHLATTTDDGQLEMMGNEIGQIISSPVSIGDIRDFQDRFTERLKEMSANM